jgi:hypothetical protein
MSGMNLTQPFNRLSESERHDLDEAIEAAKGLPATCVARLAKTIRPGVSYMGCGKKYIFADLVKEGGLEHSARSKWPQFLADLRKEPRPQSRRQRQDAAKLLEEERQKQALEEAKGWTLDAAEAELDRLDKQLWSLRNQKQTVVRKRASVTRIVYELRKQRREGFP